MSKKEGQKPRNDRISKAEIYQWCCWIKYCENLGFFKLLRQHTELVLCYENCSNLL